jgi:hypothetical protein
MIRRAGERGNTVREQPAPPARAGLLKEQVACHPEQSRRDGSGMQARLRHATRKTSLATSSCGVSFRVLQGITLTFLKN